MDLLERASRTYMTSEGHFLPQEHHFSRREDPTFIVVPFSLDRFVLRPRLDK